MKGELVSHYRIGQKIGGGGMGDVYEAEDTRLGRRVAVKFLPERLAGSRLALGRFRRESRAASALNHPHICTIYDVGQHDSQPYIVMERLRGQTLKKRMEGGALPAAEAAEFVTQLADALEAAHDVGIVHRDIKPANIFVTDRGEAKLLDFGLAKALPGDSGSDPEGAQRLMHDSTLTAPGQLLGTLAYLSPEQARGDRVDERSDLFSLGVVLYQMVTGTLPFDGRNLPDTLRQLLNQPPPPPSDLSPGVSSELEKIILSMLEKEPDVRVPSAAVLRIRLADCLRSFSSPQAAIPPKLPPASGGDIFPQPTPRGPRTTSTIWKAVWRDKRRRWLLVVGMALALALAFWLGHCAANSG